MAEHVWTVLCEKTLVEPVTNFVSLIGIVEALAFRKKTSEVEDAIENAKAGGNKGVFYPMQINLVSMWVRSDFTKPETSQMRLRVVGPSNIEISSQLVDLELDEENVTGRRITLHFERFPLIALGLHWFVVDKSKLTKTGKLGWTTVARLPVMLGAEPG